MLINILYIQIVVQKITNAAQNVRTLSHLKRLLHVAAQLQHHFKQQQIRPVQQLERVHIVQQLFHLLHRIHPHSQAVVQLW